LAYLSAAYQGFPARKLTMVGITGTDGKTTTSNMLYQVLQEAGIQTGMISTVNAVLGRQVVDTGFHVTTPDSPQIQSYLAQMVADGITHAVLETTSHGWSQHRVDGCEFDLGVVTNITHEHLDEHGSFEKYREAKARLLKSLSLTVDKKAGNPRLAVLNADDASFDYLVRTNPVAFKTYSLNGPSDVYAKRVNLTATGSHFLAVGPDWEAAVFCRFPGKYNVSNSLAAIAAAVFGLGIDPEVASRGITKLGGIPGRMESIDLGQGFSAIVDFAHTPNALKNAIETVRTFTPGRVIAIFGSAGLRDPEKRRLMAEVSVQCAGLTILTAEDPRTESLDQILAEMAAGAKEAGGVEGRDFWRVPDRGEAIRFGISLAKEGDTVIACGKGHEQSMCFGETEYPWDDRVAMRAALAGFLGLDGPRMPALPTSP
jgi:UDP-N-acetylmuramoyl-L-alanyl-D-glutamate--2,6-diaminopimelate ligase